MEKSLRKRNLKRD